jgi:hypothetical protein
MTSSGTAWAFDDGGRAAAGFGRIPKGMGGRGDCVCRAIAIATERPYRDVYDELTAIGWMETGYKFDVDGLVLPRHDTKEAARAYLASLGWQWTPTMRIGSGCRVHLRADELPGGRIIARVTGHLAAVIDGVIHDTHDCSRGGTRCVYGFFYRPAVTP